MARVTFLSYRHAESLIHKIPAIIKIVILFFISIRIFSDSKAFFLKELGSDICFINAAVLFRIIFYFIVVVCFFILAKTPISHLRNLFFVLIIGLFVLIFRCINFFPLQIMTQEIPNAILYIVRFFIATLMAMVVFETTSAIEIINSLSNFHNLFAKKIPFLRKWNFLLILALSINFIPQIFFVWEQLKVAAKARTFTGNRYNFIGKIRTLVAQFSGVVSCMLQRSNEIRKIIISKS